MNLIVYRFEFIGCISYLIQTCSFHVCLYSILDLYYFFVAKLNDILPMSLQYHTLQFVSLIPRT